MKRLLAFGLFGLGTAVLFGCPIYPSDRDHRVCVNGDCFDCPDSFYSDACRSWTCDANNDCPSGYSCNSSYRCKLTGGTPNTPPPDGTCQRPADCTSQTCGADNKCHAQPCDKVGCPSGFTCALQGGSNGVPACIAIDSDGGGTTSSCKNDRDCPTPTGSRCLTGSCVSPQDQCVDATQCADGQCVQGACTLTCSDTKTCPTGYGCDTAKGVCTGNPQPCTSSTQCTSGPGTVCVQEHCVEPCGAGGTCRAGLKCVDGGCTPDQHPVFTCSATDGAQGECQQGSICLRHSCYIACNPALGTEACKNADQLNECKSVTTGSGTHNVCSRTNNLGSECDPTKACSSPLVCIDGYCK